MSGTSFKVPDLACKVYNDLALLIEESCALFKGMSVGREDPGLEVAGDWGFYLFRFSHNHLILVGCASGRGGGDILLQVGGALWSMLGRGGLWAAVLGGLEVGGVCRKWSSVNLIGGKVSLLLWV